jgi:hypothetical protein
MAGHDEARIARLLAALRPAPDDWVRDAEALPLATGTLARVLARAETDPAFRTALLRDPEAVLAEAGYESDPRVVRTLRQRLADEPPG